MALSSEWGQGPGGFAVESANFLRLLWEIPLAIASLVFYRVMRAILSRLYRFSLGRKPEDKLQWQVLSADTLAHVPLALPVLMTTGPRWNTHAVIGTLGPFGIERSIELDMATIQRSAQSWVAVVYRFPSYETVQSLDSHGFRQLETSANTSADTKAYSSTQSSAEPSAKAWFKLTLPAGRYSLGVRYYDCAEAIIYPEVRLDGDAQQLGKAHRLLPSHSADPNTNDFYHQLKGYPHKAFYLAMHYYTYILLKYRRYLPEAWVQREYLPVGAPDTQFFYGGLNKGETMQIELDPDVLSQFYFYLSLYDWSSFPMAWQRIQTTHTEQLAAQNGSYTFRVRPKLLTPAGIWPEFRETRSPAQSGVDMNTSQKSTLQPNTVNVKFEMSKPYN